MANTTWNLDTAHSEIQFKVKHMMIATVTGAFKNFTASVSSNGDDFDQATVAFSAEIASIDTGNEQRDAHLRSADFFDAEQFPNLVFSDGIIQKKGDDYVLKGTLTIKDIAHPVSLDVEFGGIGTDPWGNTKAGFTLSGKINRKYWGLNWNAALETGGVLVSEDVRLQGEIQLAKA
jgi:polyisoprenoid-binding protein YceI